MKLCAWVVEKAGIGTALPSASLLSGPCQVDNGIVTFPPGVGNRVTLRLTALSEQVELEVALR